MKINNRGRSADQLHTSKACKSFTSWVSAVLLGWAALTLAGSALAQSDLPRGEVLVRHYDFQEANRPEQEYTLYIPTGYSDERPAPLVILLHGLGSNPQQVINYQGITTHAETHGYIVAAPYGYNERGWYGNRGAGNVGAPAPANADAGCRRIGAAANNDPENLGELSELDVLNVLALVREEFNVDDQRIYLMGHSMGGGGTLYLGMKHSDIWAGLAPLAPAIWTSPDQLSDIVDMPVILVQGEADTLVTVELVRPWAAKLEELGMNHRYIEIPGGDHVVSFSRNPDMIGEVFEFFNANPKR